LYFPLLITKTMATIPRGNMAASKENIQGHYRKFEYLRICRSWVVGQAGILVHRAALVLWQKLTEITSQYLLIYAGDIFTENVAHSLELQIFEMKTNKKTLKWIKKIPINPKSIKEVSQMIAYLCSVKN